jgi:hypothetical protein
LVCGDNAAIERNAGVAYGSAQQCPDGHVKVNKNQSKAFDIFALFGINNFPN